MYLLPKPTKTLEGLPVVSRDTRSSFLEEIIRDLNKESHAELFKKWAREIKSENPEILQYAIYDIAKWYPENLQVPIASALINLYRMLKSQIGNDKIREYWGQPAKE